MGEAVAVPQWDPLLGKVAHGRATGELAERVLTRRFGTAVSSSVACLPAPTRQ